MKNLAKSLIASVFATGVTVAAPVFASSGPIECGTTYTVKRGDVLGRINVRAYGKSSFRPLYNHNKSIIGSNPNVIVVGMTLEIPCKNSDGTFAAMPGMAVVATTQVAQTDTVAPQTREAADEAVQSDVVVLAFNKTSAPPFVINSGIIDVYLNEITEVTEGRVQFVDPEVINRDQADQFELVTSGQVDGAYVLNSKLSASHPLLQLPMLPLNGGSAEQTATSLWRLHEEYLSKTDYFDDAHLLGFIAAPAAHIWRESDTPVLASENVAARNMYAVPYFEGLDVRGPKALQEEVSTWMADYKESNTADPTFFLAHGAARAVGIWNENVTVTEVDYGLYTPTFSVILSNDAWAKISDADQEAITSISGEALSARSASWDAFDNGFRSDMVRNNLKIVKADDALLDNLQEYADQGLELWSMYANAKGIPADEAHSFYQHSLKSLEDRLLFR